jgi:hypothetical protein
MSDSPVITGVSIFVGFLVGLMISGGCLLFSIWLGQVTRAVSEWIYPVTNGALIVVAGFLALRYYQRSGIARGVVVAVGLVFLVNGICGLTLMH